MVLTNKRSGPCWKCTEKNKGKGIDAGVQPVTRGYTLTRAMFQAKNNAPSQIIDCWECKECHNLVPVNSWNRYVQTGEIVVYHDKEGRIR